MSIKNNSFYTVVESHKTIYYYIYALWPRYVVVCAQKRNNNTLRVIL